MTSRAVLTKWSWLFAALFAMGLVACSSDDSSGGTADAQPDRAADTGRDVPLADTPTTEVGQDLGVDTGADLPVTDTTADMGNICDEIGLGTNIGNACDQTDETACGPGGACVAFAGDEATTCYQACIETVCDSLCAGVAGDCFEVADTDGNPIEVSPGLNLGLCLEPPTGTQGAYDECDVANPDMLCETGMVCATITSATGSAPMCLPECAATEPMCPGLESVTGACFLGAAGSDPTHCGLECVPGAGAVCPAGMQCYNLTSGGICLWPES